MGNCSKNPKVWPLKRTLQALAGCFLAPVLDLSGVLSSLWCLAPSGIQSPSLLPLFQKFPVEGNGPQTPNQSLFLGLIVGFAFRPRCSQSPSLLRGVMRRHAIRPSSLRTTQPLHEKSRASLGRQRGEGLGQKLMMRNKERRTRERGAESFRGDDEGFVLAVGVSAGN